MSPSTSHVDPTSALPSPSGTSDLGRSLQGLGAYVPLGEREGSIPDADRVSAVIVIVLTLACTVVSMFDLYLLASHAS